MAFRVGQRVGGYEFLRILDSSGTTIVYEVYNEAAGRREALKLLPKEMNGDKRAVERFLREAKIRSSLSHPHIATFYRGFELEGELVMTHETADTPTLEERLEEGPLTMTESIDIMMQVLEALHHAHNADVVHRELTPANVYLSAAGHAKLSGFAMARQAEDPKLTKPGLVSGPVHYLSPEQAKGFADVDGRSDVYSAGVLLFEVITGAKPFDSRSQFDIMQAHVMSAPPEPSDLREDVPPELSAVILKALEKFPEERYSSAEELREALARVRPQIVALETKEKSYVVRPPMENLDDDIAEAAAEVRRPNIARRSPRARAAMAAGRGPLSAPDWDAAEDEGNDGFQSAPLPLTTAPALPERQPTQEKDWQTRELAMVGLLAFVIVTATMLAVMFMFNA